MLKFLRKYNKVILVIGGVLLMIAFVAPQAIQNLGPNPQNRVVGTIDAGDPVRAGELDLAAREVNALKAYLGGVAMLTDDDEEAQWYLLTHAAEQGGFIGGQSDGVNWIPQLAEEFHTLNYFQTGRSTLLGTEEAQQELLELTARMQENVQYAAGRSGLSLDQFEMTLARLRGVLRMRSSYNAAPSRMSDTRIIDAARRDLDRAYADYVFIPATAFADTIAEPTDEQLQAQFDEFRELKPGEGEFGIGYTLPARIKFRALTLDRLELLQAANPDPIEVRKTYQRDRDTYPGEFAQERPRIEQALSAQLVSEMMTEADQIIRSQVLDALRQFNAAGVYRDIPQDQLDRLPSFEALAQAVADGLRAKYDLDIRPPSITTIDTWTTQADLFAVPDIGRAIARRGSQSFMFPNLVLQVRELAGNNDLGIQIGVPAVDLPLTDALGNRSYMLVTDIREESPPDSIEEIRAQLTSDYKNLRAYEALLERRAALESTMNTEGTVTLADQFSTADDPVQPRLNQSIQRAGVFLPEQPLNTPEFTEFVLERASKLDPLAQTQDLTDDARTFSVPMPEALAIAVVRLNQYLPLTEQRFATQALRQAQSVRNKAQAEIFDAQDEDPFSLAALRARFNYKSQDEEDEPEPEPTESASAG